MLAEYFTLNLGSEFTENKMRLILSKNKGRADLRMTV